MKSERYSKFLAGLVTSLILFSLFISPALATAPNNDAKKMEKYSSSNSDVSNSALVASWTVNYTSPVGQIKALAVYNGKLYAGGFSGQSNAHLFVYDGNTWSDLNFSPGVGASLDMIEALQVHNNRLYIGTRVYVGSAYYSRVYYYDGTTFAQDFSTAGTGGCSGIEDLAIHNDILYAANGACGKGEVFQRIGDNNWSSVGGLITPSREASRSLASYKGSLYTGTGTSGSQAKVWRWNGSLWELNANIASLFGINQDGIWSLAANNDFLYAGTAGPNGTSVIPVYDGISWTASIPVAGNTRLSVINNQIWAGAGDGKIFWNNGSWQEYGIVSNVYDFAEYEGYIYAAGSTGRIYRTESPYYSITGKITDAIGTAIPNVLVSDGTEHTVTTDSSGNYTLSGLVAGTYTITPSKSGYTFSPASRAVTVPPDSTGQDFTGTLVPPTGKTPIVFAHGWNGLGVPPPFCSSVQVDPDSYFEQVDENLQAAGYYVGYAYLESSPCYTPSLVDNVDNLKAAIDQAKTANPGQSKVILIAHSMGGLVARAYIEGPNSDYRDDVAALFTFGSPHLGVPQDAIAFLLNGVTLGSACENYQPAVCDFSTLGMILFNMNHHNNGAVTYHVISGDAPFFSRSPLGMAMDALIWGPDDGIVPTDSGRAVFLGTFDRWTTDEVHGPGSGGLFNFGPRTYFIRDGGTSTSYTDCIKKVLVDDASPNCGTVSAASVTQQDIPATLAQHTPIEYGTLLSGQTATRNISLEGGLTLFASQWQDGALAFTLVDPNGQTIDPAFAAANPGVVTYTEDANSATYYFPNATAGAWQMALQAVSVPASASFTTFAAFDSNVTLAGSTDKDWYIPGASATLTATLGGSPSSATVTATILRADGVTDPLTLSSIGGGQYQASYSVPAAPGYAEVRLVASGMTASSLSFERGTSLTFQISPNTFILNNTYSDALVAPDLNVTVGINAAVSGKVGLSADLVDGNGNFVAHGLTIQDVVAGTPTLTLQFDGADIFASQRNGPYTLTNLLLTDETGATLVTQQAQAVYTTAPYLYTDFAPNRIYLPLILR